MLDDMFVINPVAHAYNLEPDNLVPSRYSTPVYELLQALCIGWNPPDIGLSPEMLATDWPIETLAKTLFLETEVDMAAHHTLRLDSYFKDGLCRHEKTREAVDRYPERFLAYVGVEPTMGLQACLDDFERQIEEIPNAVGLKLYPAQVNPLRSWRMDDPDLAYPLFERAQKLGIKTVAIHKAIPNGPVPMNPYRVDDVDGAAIHFPDLSFEIVHSGLAFVEETAHAIARLHNVYANLEITSLLTHHAPERFDEPMAQFHCSGSYRVTN